MRTLRTRPLALGLLALAIVVSGAVAALAAPVENPLLRRQNPVPVNVNGQTTAWDTGRDYVGIFADPDVVHTDGRWYAYATNTSHMHLPTLVSDDLERWRPVTNYRGDRYDPLPEVGSWVQDPDGGGGLWAPGVAKMGDFWTVAYSAQKSTVQGVRHNCIGLARADHPAGPFYPLTDKHHACGRRSPMGVIDPDLYVDPQGRNWMLWKFSGIPRRHPATIFIRQLNSQGTDWAPGSRKRALLSHRPDGWEGDTIENPAMIHFRGVTYLFYSANSYRNDKYATGYAICEGPTGPCHRARKLPLLSTATTGHLGPGGASAFEHNDTLHLMYHAWEPGKINVLRRMRIATLRQRKNNNLLLKYPG